MATTDRLLLPTAGQWDADITLAMKALYRPKRRRSTFAEYGEYEKFSMEHTYAMARRWNHAAYKTLEVKPRMWVSQADFQHGRTRSYLMVNLGLTRSVEHSFLRASKAHCTLLLFDAWGAAASADALARVQSTAAISSSVISFLGLRDL